MSCNAETRIFSDFFGSAVVSTASVGVPPTELVLPELSPFE
jgi:hypothetical protein